MPDALGSKKSTIYMGRGATFQGGDPSSDEHIPINPLPAFEGALVKYLQAQATTADQEIHNIEWDEKLEEGSCTLSGYYRDPFLLLAMLSYVTVTGTWSGTGDIITGAFTNKNNLDQNIWIQLHSHDQSGDCKHNDLLFDGGQVQAYKLIGEMGKPLVEEGEVIFSELDENIQPINVDNGFDDAKFNQTAAAEVSTVVAVAKASIVEESYFIIQVISATWVRTTYNIWFDVAGDGTFTASPGVGTDVKCDVSGDTTAQDVSDTITAAITALSDVSAANGGGTSETVTITNGTNGDVRHIVDVDSLLVVATTTIGETEQDGGWSMWDGEYTASTSALTRDCTITWGGVAIAGLEWKKFTLEISVPKSMIFVGKQLKALDFYDGVRPPYKMSIEGILKGNDNISEAIAALTSKTKQTLKVQWGSTNVQYIQFTNAYIQSIEPIGAMPEAGTPVECTFNIVAGASSVLNYNWTGNEATDPSPMINHTDS